MQYKIFSCILARINGYYVIVMCCCMLCRRWPHSLLCGVFGSTMTESCLYTDAGCRPTTFILNRIFVESRYCRSGTSCARSAQAQIELDDDEREADRHWWWADETEAGSGISKKSWGLTIAQLIGQKCLPVLLYCLEVCSLSKRHMQSLDFTVNRVLMKLFKSSNIDIINVCRDMFNFRLPSELLAYRSEKFLFNVATDVCLR